LLLASIGVYGLMNYDVAQRTREIGLRMALGAQMKQVALRFVWAALRLGVAGVVVGSFASLVTARMLQSVLFEVRASDMMSHGAVTLVLLGVTFVAAYFPARRAARVDPTEALRSE
jgi:ABC-type antimicrobial peptide transport system permease subunit